MNQKNNLLRIATISGFAYFCLVTVGFSQGKFGAFLPPEQLFAARYVHHKLIRLELKTSDEQDQKLDALKRESREADRKLFEGFRTTAPAERQLKLAEIAIKRAIRQAGDDRRVLAILTKEQQQRLQGIAVQLRGPLAFCTKEVIDALKLDRQQEAKMKQLRVEHSNETRRIALERADGLEAGRAMLKDIETMGTRLKKRAVELLSPAQKKAYQSMIGAEFDTAKLSVDRF